MDKPNGFAATKASHLNTADLCAQQRITQQDPEIVAVNKIMDLGQQGEHTLVGLKAFLLQVGELVSVNGKTSFSFTVGDRSGVCQVTCWDAVATELGARLLEAEEKRMPRFCPVTFCKNFLWSFAATVLLAVLRRRAELLDSA